MINTPPSETTAIARWVTLLESIRDGENATEQLIAIGKASIPYLERFLLDSPPRSLALGRCRAVRALGQLGACSALIAYFQQYTRPGDAAVLFAEDAVRSAAAQELLHCGSEAVFPTLVNATQERATSGLVQALGEFRRPEAVPVFFELLEDDLCREDAKAALRKIPDAARPYAMLMLRGQAAASISGAAASRRRRATLQLLAEWGASASEWPELRGYLWNEDADCVIATARIGLRAAPEQEKEEIAAALIEGSQTMNWAQETEAVELLDSMAGIAKPVAARIAAHRGNLGETPNWMSPFWRTVRHLQGASLESRPGSAA